MNASHRRAHGAWSVVTALAALGTLLCACTPRQEFVWSGPTMGTTYTVKIAASTVDSHAVRVLIDQVLARVDEQMSGYRPDSEIARFNASRSTEWFAVSPELAEVTAVALQVGQRSQGALDVTIGPLLDLWGFGRGGERVPPDAAQIAVQRERVGGDKLHARLTPPALRKEIAALEVNLNSIAPGYAVDLLAARIAAAGHGNFLVDIGGEIRAQGRNRSGEPWRVAVERPFDAERSAFAVLQLDNLAVATSGDYRQYFEYDGRRFSHTIDPRTGGPVSDEVASVVVVAATAMLADAWSTALLVLGTEQGMVVAERENIAAMFVLRDGAALTHRSTSGMSRYVAVTPGPGIESRK